MSLCKGRGRRVENKSVCPRSTGNEEVFHFFLNCRSRLIHECDPGRSIRGVLYGGDSPGGSRTVGVRTGWRKEDEEVEGTGSPGQVVEVGRPE